MDLFILNIIFTIILLWKNFRLAVSSLWDMGVLMHKRLLLGINNCCHYYFQRLFSYFLDLFECKNRFLLIFLEEDLRLAIYFIEETTVIIQKRLLLGV